MISASRHGICKNRLKRVKRWRYAYLDREGDYEKAEYEIGYIQMEGKGEVTDSEGVRLVNREVRPLAEVPELDRENPVRQVFTLFTVRQVPDARN